MSKRTNIVENQTFQTGPLAITDIHNAGNVFACLYRYTIQFIEYDQVILKPEIIKSGGLEEWTDSILKTESKGSYLENEKHIALSLNSNLGESFDAYIEVLDSNLIYGEFYFLKKAYPKSLVFERK